MAVPETPRRDVTHMNRPARRHDATASPDRAREVALAICREDGPFRDGSQDGGPAVPGG